jgi:hypothetical protein
MFFKFLQPILEPFRRLRSKGVQIKQVKGNIKMDVKRVQGLKNIAGAQVKDAKGAIDKGKGAVDKAGGQVKDAKGKVAGAKAGAPGAPAAPGAAAPAINPNPGVKKVGLFGRKRVCEQCGNELDKSWDGCPYCAQAAAAAAQPAAASQKTQAFMIDHSGSGGMMQLLGWIVPVQGPQRGELYSLAPVSVVGTDPTCTVVLHDQYMSSRHAEIKAEGGVWILRDLGSTNGTYVNDKRVDKHELVDNDFVKFGQSLVKFKSL